MEQQIGLSGFTDNAEGLQAKAVESMLSLTAVIHKRLASMFTKKHLLLFEVILALEKLKRKGELSDQACHLLIHGIEEFCNDNDNEISETLSPDFGNPKSSTHNLYQKYHHQLLFLETEMEAFKGISTSFSNNEIEWGEYFTNPVISLVSPTPGEISGNFQFTQAQRAILWRIFVPSKIAMVLNCLVTYELGASLIRQRTRVSYVPTLDQIFSQTSAARPLLIISSSQQINHVASREDPICLHSVLSSALYKQQKVFEFHT